MILAGLRRERIDSPWKRELPVKALRKINAEPFFTAIVAGDPCPRRKPDPMPLQRACEFLGGKASSVLDGGRFAQRCPSGPRRWNSGLVVPHGYREGLSADDLGADMIVELHELPALVRAHRLRSRE
jgi:phosphoglycolate phosphatase